MEAELIKLFGLLMEIIMTFGLILSGLR